VIFHKLDKEMLEKIVDIQLERVNQLISEKGYRLEIEPDAIKYIAEVGYDPEFGARPLKRAIQRELQDPLAIRMLSGEFKPGSTIVVTKGKEGLEFSPKKSSGG
jgi:ATP-dependent Clp protease ATP-binding subunit ClpB